MIKAMKKAVGLTMAVLLAVSMSPLLPKVAVAEPDPAAGDVGVLKNFDGTSDTGTRISFDGKTWDLIDTNRNGAMAANVNEDPTAGTGKMTFLLSNTASGDGRPQINNALNRNTYFINGTDWDSVKWDSGVPTIDEEWNTTQWNNSIGAGDDGVKNEYAGDSVASSSLLRRQIDWITNLIKSNATGSREYDVISARELKPGAGDTSSDGVAGVGATDKLWPLSYKEAEELQKKQEPVLYFNNYNTRENVNTSPALYDPEIDQTPLNPRAYTNSWWLRTPEGIDEASYVSGTGKLNTTFVDVNGDGPGDGDNDGTDDDEWISALDVEEFSYAVRPAFQINTADVVLTSSATNSNGKGLTYSANGNKVYEGKTLSLINTRGVSQEGQTADDLELEPDPEKPLKLTVTHSDFSGFSATAGQKSGYLGAEITIPYSNAVVGSDNAVSVVLEVKGADGNVTTYYSRVVSLDASNKYDDAADSSVDQTNRYHLSADGTANGDLKFNIPTDLPEGDHTYKVFNESISANDYTDFSSPAISGVLRAGEVRYSVGLHFNDGTTADQTIVQRYGDGYYRNEEEAQIGQDAITDLNDSRANPELVVPSRDGYAFKGFYPNQKDAAGNVLVPNVLDERFPLFDEKGRILSDGASDDRMSTGEVKPSNVALDYEYGNDPHLYAKWEEKTGYSITFDSNGGSAVLPKTGLSWSSKNLLPAAPTWAGHKFVNWQGAARTATIGNPNSTFGDLVKDANETDKENPADVLVELTATWDTLTTTTLNPNGGAGGTAALYTNKADGSGTADANIYTTNTGGAPLPAAGNIAVPTRANFIFEGYYTSLNGAGTMVYSATGARVPDAATTKNLLATTPMLYAHWSRDLSKATINTIAVQNYRAGGVRPVPVVMHAGVHLVANVHYTVTYSNNVNVSKAARVTVTGRYSATANSARNSTFKVFSVRPARPAKPKVALVKGRKLKVTWAAMPRGVTRIELSYKLTTAKAWKKVNLGGTVKTRTLTGLTAGKRYHVRIRPTLPVASAAYSLNATSGAIRR